MMIMASQHPHSPRFRLWFWAASLVLFFWFLSLVSSILLPFVVGMLAAYFLDPAVRRLRSWGLSRGSAAAIITVAFFAIAIGLGVLLVPPIIHQTIALLRELPDDLHRLQVKYGEDVQQYLAKIGADQMDSIKDSLGNYSGKLIAWAGGMATGALQSGLALLNILSLIFITPIVAFYLLRDWHMMVIRFYALLPRDQTHVIREQLHEIDRTLSGFIRGQTNVCLIFASYYGLLLSLLGLNFGLLIGIATGFLLFIPFVGYACCFVISMVIATFQYPDSAHILMVFGVYAVGVVIESSFVTPRLVGGKVGLHPLWIIFGMLAGGALFGFVGILISVPLTAVVGVLVRFAIRRYLHSSLYTGEPHIITDTTMPSGTDIIT